MPEPEHAGQEHEQDEECDRDDGVLGAPEADQHEVPAEGADHEDLAVGEVQELEDPVDHRVAERDQRVDAPERQAVDELLDEEVEVHGGKSLSRKACGPPGSGWAASLGA